MRLPSRISPLGHLEGVALSTGERATEIGKSNESVIDFVKHLVYIWELSNVVATFSLELKSHRKVLPLQKGGWTLDAPGHSKDTAVAAG